MRKLFTLTLTFLAALSLAAQPLRVLSNQPLGQGFSPRISADGQNVLYLQNEHVAYVEEAPQGTYVTNEDLNVVLYRNGQRTVLNPRGNELNYCWPTLSPDKTRILFTTKYGTEVCDLQGHILANLGHVNAPQWMGNDLIIGHHTTSDSHQFTSACIVAIRPDGTGYQELSDPQEFGMFPSVSERTGRIAYSTLNGDMRLMQTNYTAEPIATKMPAVRLAEPAQQQLMKAPKRARKTNFSDLKIYINPGHGGHTGNDRPMHIYPFRQNDPESFWESNSNLDKGLRLRDMLNALGVQTKMSRIYNEEEDDLDLDVIVAQANAYNADFMLSIHSNAGNPSNYILQLYAGRNADDNTTYSDMGQASDESRAITTLMGDILYENKVSDWTHVPQIWGDKTFARKIMGWSNGYGVLRWLRVPGTISEGCMHDYIPETYRLMNMDYKWRESFYFLRTFMEYYFDYTLPEGAIGGQVRDAHLPMTFPKISYHKNSPDAMKPINRATVKLYQGSTLLQTYQTDTLYNGCYFFWDLTPGTYRVRVEADGYYPYEYDETVTAAHISYHNSFINMERNTPLEVVSYLPHPAAITDSVDVSTVIVMDFNWDCWADSTIAAFSITPAVEGELTLDNDNHTLRFQPAGRLEPGVEYTATLSTLACHPDAAFSNHLAQPFVLTFRTKSRGSIRYVQSYPANGETDVPVNPSFVMLFDQTLVNATARTAFSLVDAAGKEVKVNTRSFNYNKAPEPYGYASFELTEALQPSSQYTLTIDGSLKDNIGVFLNDPKVITFTTEASYKPTISKINALDTLVFAYDAEQSFGVASASQLRNTSKKYEGTACNELKYVFSAADAEVFYVTKDPQMLTVHRGDKVGMYVFSDFSGNALELKFETAGDIKYVRLCDLDYGGWKWQEVELSELPEGVDFQLMAVRVVRGSFVLSGSGSVFLNRLAHYAAPTALDELDLDASVEKIIEDGQVYIIKNGRRYNILGTEVE